ncbi:MAG: hydroxyacid dehydrogenase, partial [Hyphomicrobiales bacterium]
LVNFGHLGDGNLHYNVSPPVDVPADDFMERQHEVNQVVHDSVHRFHGSISAEHGLGALKREEIKQYKSAVELRLMGVIKDALDPLHLMNPGKVL